MPARIDMSQLASGLKEGFKVQINREQLRRSRDEQQSDLSSDNYVFTVGCCNRGIFNPMPDLRLSSFATLNNVWRFATPTLYRPAPGALLAESVGSFSASRYLKYLP